MVAAAAKKADAVLLAGGRLARSLERKDGVVDASHNSSHDLLCFIQGFGRSGSPAPVGGAAT
jgi:hypothetical protein